MKVLLVNVVYGYASTGTIISDLKSICEQEGIECFVAYSIAKKSLDSISNGYRIGSVFEKKLHALFCRINGRQGYFSRIATYRFIRYIKKIQPDIVHLHTIHGNYLNFPIILKFLAKYHIHTVITMHDCWYYTGGCFHYTNVNCFKWQEGCGLCPKKHDDTPSYFFDKSHQNLIDRQRLFDSIPNLIITGVSNWICQESQKGIFRNKCVLTIHNGVDTTLFKRLDNNIIPDDNNLLHLAKTLDKHFVIMGLAGKWLDPVNIEAFIYILKNIDNNTSFLLFGCSERDISFVRSLNLAETDKFKISTFGYTTQRSHLVYLYNIADVFINCTREESFSLINVEPQACGTPVVTYANTGAQETVDNKCSFSVPTGDYAEMLSKVNEIRRKGKSFYSEDCMKWVYENFDMRINYNKYINLYKRLINK